MVSPLRAEPLPGRVDAVVLARDLHGIERPSALQLTFDIETELIERALQAASQLLLQGAGLGAEAAGGPHVDRVGHPDVRDARRD